MQFSYIFMLIRKSYAKQIDGFSSRYFSVTSGWLKLSQSSLHKATQNVKSWGCCRWYTILRCTWPLIVQKSGCSLIMSHCFNTSVRPKPSKPALAWPWPICMWCTLMKCRWPSELSLWPQQRDGKRHLMKMRWSWSLMQPAILSNWSSSKT